MSLIRFCFEASSSWALPRSTPFSSHGQNSKLAEKTVFNSTVRLVEIIRKNCGASAQQCSKKNLEKARHMIKAKSRGDAFDLLAIKQHPNGAFAP